MEVISKVVNNMYWSDEMSDMVCFHLICQKSMFLCKQQDLECTGASRDHVQPNPSAVSRTCSLYSW